MLASGDGIDFLVCMLFFSGGRERIVKDMSARDEAQRRTDIPNLSVKGSAFRVSMEREGHV